MPLIIISAAEPKNPEVVPQLIAEIRRNGAAAFGSTERNIWVQFHTVPRTHYAQGPEVAENSLSPIVVIKAQSGRTKEQRTALVGAVVDVISQRLAVSSDNVWVHYQEMRPEDVWFRNRWSD